MLCETLCDMFAQVCCPARVRLCVLLDSAWTANAWCGCNVRVAVLTMEHINLCAVNGTRNRFVHWSLIFWNMLFVFGYLCHCLFCCGMLCSTIYFSRWLKKLFIYFYSTFPSKTLWSNKHQQLYSHNNSCITILFSCLSIANCYESIKMKFHISLTHSLPFRWVLLTEAGL
jgi:hypothetical protein